MTGKRAEFGEPANPILRRLNNLYTRRIMPVTASLLAGDRSGAYRYLPSSIRSFLDRQELAALIRASGYEEVALHSMTFGVCVGFVGRKSRQSRAETR